MSKQGCLFSYKNTIYWPIGTSFQPNMEFITSHLINYLPCGFNQCFYDQQARSDHVQDTFKKHTANIVLIGEQLGLTIVNIEI